MSLLENDGILFAGDRAGVAAFSPPLDATSFSSLQGALNDIATALVVVGCGAGTEKRPLPIDPKPVGRLPGW